MSSNPRWLSMSGICTVLSMSQGTIKSLTKQGFLVSIGKGPATRYLDPTEEYADKLRACEALYGRCTAALPNDLSLKGFLTVGEVAQVMGWDPHYAAVYFSRKKVPSVRTGSYVLYSLATVRDFLWRRNGRKLASRRAPFLIQHLIDFFLAYHARVSEEVPTDAQFAADDLLQRKLTRMLRMKSPQREEALTEFLAKVEVAKSVVATLQSPSTT